MTKGRLEAFSDGVMAIILTIMVLEIKVPHGHDWEALRPYCPLLLGYLLSFVYIGIYWVNHHHLFHATPRVGSMVLWANLHLLFWLSFIPVLTGWIGEAWEAALPTAIYGFVLFMSGVSWLILERTIIAVNGRTGRLKKVMDANNVKGQISAVMYIVGIALAFVHTLAADAVYLCVALLWTFPDKRIEAALAHEHEAD